MVSYFILGIGCVAVIFSVAVLVSVIRDYRVEKEHRRHMAKVYGASLAKRQKILHDILGKH